MAAKETVRYYLPNKLGRLFLLSLEDVMGGTSLNAILNRATLGRNIQVEEVVCIAQGDRSCTYAIDKHPPD